MKYKPARDIPKAARQLRTLSPTKIAAWVKGNRLRTTKLGKKQQYEISPQGVTMWLKRHIQIYEELKAEVETKELIRTAITEDLFQDDVFRQIECIEKWVGKLVAREAKDTSINGMVNAIKFVCQGRLSKDKIIEDWGLIHPQDLTLDQALKYLVALRKVTTHTRRFRISLRNFLKSRGVEDWDDISGKAEAEEGKYAHLYVPRDKIEEILRRVNERNHEVYLASKFSFKTAARLTATMNAHAKYYFKVGNKQFIYVFEKASRGKPKRKMRKFIPQDLYAELPKEGKLFNVDERTINKILRAVYKEVIPEIEKELKMPFHFWRHMFAQHMLRATKWQTTKVAKMGGWTTEALERYYGKMDDRTAFEDAESLVGNL